MDGGVGVLSTAENPLSSASPLHHSLGVYVCDFFTSLSWSHKFRGNSLQLDEVTTAFYLQHPFSRALPLENTSRKRKLFTILRKKALKVCRNLMGGRGRRFPLKMMSDQVKQQSSRSGP